MANQPEKGLGIGALTALVITSSIGAGIFTLPSELAKGASQGPVILAWIFVGLGITMLALSLNNLLVKKPEATGISAYAKAGFGNFSGFISGWGYWMSAWLGNVAFAIVLINAIGYFVPSLGQGFTVPALIITSICSWGLTLIVNQGVESAASINLIITVCKLIPLFAFIVIAIFSFKFNVFSTHFWGLLHSNFQFSDVINQVKNSLMLMLWVFTGIEGASMLSNRAKSKTEAGRATMLGLVSLLIIYILATVLPYGYMSRDALANLHQPAMVYLLKDMIGPVGAVIMSIGLIISILGSWLSWTMLPAETTLLMAKDKLLPPVFGKTNKHGAPTFSLMLTAALVQIFLITLLFTDQAYRLALSLCTAALMICYIFVSLYQVKFSLQNKSLPDYKKQATYGALSAIFQIFSLAVSGLNFLLLCCIIYIPGIFFYDYAKKEYFGKHLSTKEWIITGIIVIGAIVSIFMLANGQIKF